MAKLLGFPMDILPLVTSLHHLPEQLPSAAPVVQMLLPLFLLLLELWMGVNPSLEFL